MKRVLTLLILILVILPVVGRTFAQDDYESITDDPKYWLIQNAPRFTAQANGVIGNSIYEVFVDTTQNIGSYTARTGIAHPITLATGSRQNVLFGGSTANPGTSFNTIRSYTSGTDYVQRANVVGLNSTFDVLGLSFASLNPALVANYLTTETIGTSGFRTTYRLPGPPLTPDAMTIVQDINVVGTTYEDSRIVVSVRVTNTGNSNLSVGLRYLWDFQIAGDDGPVFMPSNPAGIPLVTETAFPSPSFGFFRMQDNDISLNPPTFSVNGSVNGPSSFNPTTPDLIQYAGWTTAVGQAFDVTVDPTRVVGSGTTRTNNDSAVNYFFGATQASAINLSPGNSQTTSAYLFAIEPSANTPPVAVDDTLTVPAGQTTNINVMENDFDLDGDNLTVGIVTTTEAGADVLITFPDYQIAYTPPAGFSGEDMFFYTIEDGRGGTDTGQVFVTVDDPNTPPVANADSATTIEGTPVTVNVLNNDSDSDGNSLTVTSIIQGSSGNAVINDNNTVTFTPFPGILGGLTPAFSYIISDGNGGTAQAPVNITVNSANNPPIAVDDVATTLLNTPITIDVLANDIEPDGNPRIVESVTPPANGVANVTVGGGSVDYVPNSGFIGTDIFQYTMSDGNGLTSSATVTVHVNAPVCDPGSEVYNPAVDLKHEASMLLPETGFLVGRIVNRSAVCSYPVGMASYEIIDGTIDTQILFDATVTTIAPGQTLELQISAPVCARQIDLFYGDLLTSLNGVRYGPRLLSAVVLDAANLCGQVAVEGSAPAVEETTP
ncbi:MAG: cadherin-like domain-containing protein [Aggregatilineales bacterium]